MSFLPFQMELRPSQLDLQPGKFCRRISNISGIKKFVSAMTWMTQGKAEQEIVQNSYIFQELSRK